MSSALKRYKFQVMYKGGSHTEFIEARNPAQAREIAESRYPSDYRFGGFNQVYN